MDQQQLDIRDQQKASWDKFSPGWKKWDARMMDFLKPMGDKIIELIEPGPADDVLDIATGTGEPGISIAGIARHGSVIGTDLSPLMIELANEQAQAKHITNYSARVADVSELPFDDAHFDAISCRMGFMFFPDMALAAKEMYRVLKPGGRMATSVWGAPEKNTWIGAMMSALKKNLEMPAPPPNGPSMFRCASPGMIAGLLTAAGFTTVNEQLVEGTDKYESSEHYWTVMNDVAAPVVAALGQTDDTTRKKVKEDLFKLLKEKQDKDGSIVLPYSSIIIAAVK